METRQVDELAMEYLLFRGFTQTFRLFNKERSSDKSRGFDVERIMDQLFTYVAT